MSRCLPPAGMCGARSGLRMRRRALLQDTGGRGADYVLGLDLCPPMIEATQALQGDRDEYKVADVQDLGFLADESFDLAVSYLNQCDLPDFEATHVRCGAC